MFVDISLATMEVLDENEGKVYWVIGCWKKDDRGNVGLFMALPKGTFWFATQEEAEAAKVKMEAPILIDHTPWSQEVSLEGMKSDATSN